MANATDPAPAPPVTRYAVEPWCDGWAVVYQATKTSVQWYRRKCDAVRCFNRYYASSNRA